MANRNDDVEEKSASHTQIYLKIGWKNSARLKVLKRWGHKKRIKGCRCQMASFFFNCCHLHFTLTEMPKCAGKTRQAKCHRLWVKDSAAVINLLQAGTPGRALPCKTTPTANSFVFSKYLCLLCHLPRTAHASIPLSKRSATGCPIHCNTHSK